MNICFSGGAEGSDALWGKLASELGHAVCHYTFKGHKTHVPERYIEVLSQEMLNIADPFLKTANKSLGRNFPTQSNYINNLLRRNYYQINQTKVVYAIVDFDDNMVPKGGTAWAIQMAIDQGLPVFLYSPNRQCWYEWAKEFSEIDLSQITPEWVRGIKTWHMLGIEPPVPKEKWTGIGTRSISKETEDYITEFMIGQ